jgi:hypothetical protein
MEVLVMLAGIAWYWRNCRRYPHTGILLAVVPLFFAWRSSWWYFFGADIILLAVIIIEDYGGRTRLNAQEPEISAQQRLAGDGPDAIQ